MNHDRTIGIIAAVILAVILIGEVVVYTSGTDDYRTDVSVSDNELDYSVSVDGSQPFKVIVMENSMVPTDEIYVYYDENYASAYSSEEGPVGSNPTDQEYFLDQLTKNMSYRGAPPYKVLNASELAEAMENDPADHSKGLIVASGVLPDTVYRGNPDDLIFSWLETGGRLYWAGNLLGAYYASTSGITPVTGYQEMFFGSDCLNDGAANVAHEDVSDNDIRYLLALKNNRVKYAVDVQKLPAGTDYLAVGYSEGNYSSIVFTGYGNGEICVMGGDLSRNMWNDASQIISSGIHNSSIIIDYDEGSVRYGTATGTMELDSVNDLSAYVYLGGYYPVYGKFFDLTGV